MLLQRVIIAIRFSTAFDLNQYITIIADEVLHICDAFNLDTNEYFFDRSSRIFENILGLYRKGELHLAASVCPRDFLGELDYWGLSPLHLGVKTVKL